MKVLGTLALIDEGETDWKVIVINTEDPEAASFNSMNSVQRKLPALLGNMKSITRVTHNVGILFAVVVLQISMM